MLDEFLQTAYTHETRKKAEYEMVGLLKDIPTLELRKLASGTPVAELYEKRAYGDCAPKSPDGPAGWLDQFKDTPYFEEAMALEQEMLEAEAADIAKRMQENAQPRPWEVMDQIRLKKRILELKMAKEQAGAAGGAPPASLPGEPAQGAGAPGPVPAEGVQDNSQGLQGGVAKMSSVQATKTAAEMVQFSDKFARALARSDFEKAARVQVLIKTGSAAGELLAKTAGIGSALAGLAGKTLNGGMVARMAGEAATNPAAAKLIGAGVGAAGGALAGGPEHRLSGALGGAAVGAGLGHAASGISKGLINANTLGESVKGYGGELQSAASGLLGKAKGMLGGGGAPAVAPKPGGMNVQSMPAMPDMRAARMAQREQMVPGAVHL
jgi:hypothetical protein